MARRLRGCWLVAALLMITYGCVPISTRNPRPSPTVAPLVEGRCPRDGDGLIPPNAPDDPYAGGLAPSGFVATGVIQCQVDEPVTRKDGRLGYPVRELSGGPSAELETALALPDDDDQGGVCPARYVPPLHLLLIDANGLGYWPRIPITSCHEARPEIYAAVGGIAWRDFDRFEVVREP